MDKQFKPLNSGEVLSVSKSNQFMIGHSTFRVQEFMNTLCEQMSQHGFGTVSSEKAQWFSEEGIECEVLQFGSGGWQKGTVRLYLEFAPNETVPQSLTSTPTPVLTKTPVTPVVEKSPPVTKEEIEQNSEEELIVETEATATATAELEMAQEDDDLSFSDDFESNSDLGFDESLNDDLSTSSDDFGSDLGADDGLGDDFGLGDDDDGLGDDFGSDLGADDDDLGDDFGSDLGADDDDLGDDFGLGDDNGLGDDFGLGDDDFSSSNNTDGEGLGLGDVFGDDDNSLDLNLGDDAMDDVWGEMEDL